MRSSVSSLSRSTMLPEVAEVFRSKEQCPDLGKVNKTLHTNIDSDDGTEESSSMSSSDVQSSNPGDKSCVADRIDNALHTLKSELLAMRQQDLALLKQLIHINDNIRRLKRSRSMRFSAARTVSCGTLGISTPSSSSSSSSSSPPEDKVPGSGGKARVATLLRQKSEPGLFGLPPRRVSTLTSTSSFETIDDAEEVDSLYGSATDLDTAPTTPGTPSSCTTPTTPVTRSSSSYTCLTFTPEELYNGESSYGEILKRNVRLWKWSVAREKDLGIVDGHLCVL